MQSCKYIKPVEYKDFCSSNLDVLQSSFRLLVFRHDFVSLVLRLEAVDECNLVRLTNTTKQQKF